ncbi:MAG: 16S rRNA (cytosine(1402)-N(4))-methyltransferase RsmH, partial [Desulfuromonadaceae bacterium]|nr:16S rRNA (cytosine(1402)-N(4))-methyltransferase RsmH [Desulfuromonadaceae bacterium]
MAEFHHLSVLPDEVIRFLEPADGKTYLDGTLGGGGHAALILEKAPDALLIGIDRDQSALAAAGARLVAHGEQVRLVHGDFADIAHHLNEIGIAALDGFILDLGVSSHQLDTRERGFSFQQDAPLDMRMDTSSGETAADLVNGLPEPELERIISQFGEERWAKRIASFIVKERAESLITTTFRLVDI